MKSGSWNWTKNNEKQAEKDTKKKELVLLKASSKETIGCPLLRHGYNFENENVIFLSITGFRFITGPESGYICIIGLLWGKEK